MTQQEKKVYLLRGVDEYNKKRKDIDLESESKNFIMINGIMMIKITCPFEEYAREHNLINVEDVRWHY